MTQHDTNRDEPLRLSFFDRVDAADQLREACKKMTSRQMVILRRGARKLKAMRLRDEAEMSVEGRSRYGDEDGR